MFSLAKLEDLVRVKPEAFKLSRLEAIEDELNKKYGNKVVLTLGLALRVYDISSVSDPIVHACQDGSYQCKGTVSPYLVQFRVMLFKPEIGEVMTGEIKSGDAEIGLRINVDFFDDIYIPPVQMAPNTAL